MGAVLGQPPIRRCVLPEWQSESHSDFPVIGPVPAVRLDAPVSCYSLIGP